MNQIICNDALTALKDIDDKSVDIVLTSPPYNFDMQYDEHDDKSDALKYIDTLVNIFSECKRTLKDGGRLIINIQPNYKDYFPSHHFLTTELVKSGLIWRGEILWLKNNLKKLTAWGSFKSPSCPYLNLSKCLVRHLSSIREIETILILLRMSSSSMSMDIGQSHLR